MSFSARPAGARLSGALLASLALSFVLSACTSAVTDDKTGKKPDYPDADRDSIIDMSDGEEDFDGDGKPNYQDPDSDGDGLYDRIEAGDDDPYTMPIDSDGDGQPDFLDLDSDNNGLPDRVEAGSDSSAPLDTDGDGAYDYRDADNDGDGILDEIEINGKAADPADSDSDGIPDYMDIDSDGDGIGDIYESGTTEWETDPVDTDSDGTPDYLDDDSDGDGISDTHEGGVKDGMREPRDTDGDGFYDFEDSDSDGDGLRDADERPIYGTDPYDSDSDGDGEVDGAEVAVGTDPLDATDRTGAEGIYIEVPERSSQEETFEFDLSIQMGDIAFVIDTTGSMTGTANAMATEFINIVADISATIDDAAYGYATHDDYNYGSLGSGPDKPFDLQQQITTEETLVQAELSATVIHGGDDWTESQHEAIYQGASGVGYDQACNGRYDSSDDVRPFIASGSDPFGGSGGESYDPSTPDGGIIGGFGFRDYALPIMVHATDAPFREPGRNTSPRGCPADATSSMAIGAMNDIGARYIGIDVGSGVPTPYMQTVAAGTGSYADTDGDGAADDLLVFRWTGSSTVFRNTVVNAISQLVNSITFERVELQVEGDTYGFVTEILPPYYDSIDPSDAGGTLTFTLTFLGTVAATTEDQTFILTLNVVGDGTIMLDSYSILVVVPGTSY